MPVKTLDLSSEVKFKTSRSGGAGGQHVNKVSTKVELQFNIQKSEFLSAAQKSTLLRRLENRINKIGILRVVVDSERFQIRNERIALERLHELVQEALKPIKKRVPTKPTRSSLKRRLKTKKLISLKKQRRRATFDKDD
ncbi:MAG: aminoacyl-tRNA hydrolase [Bacteroidetes bacterium]|nr:aminoacyl-tRNA hydrolase [Bacteroidota bacterium]